MKKRFLMLAFAATTIISCEKQDLSYPNMEITVFYPDEPNSYLWSDLNNPNMGWEEMNNGELFIFQVLEEELKVESDREYEQVWILEDGEFIETDLNQLFEVEEIITFRFKIK
jgi:hypothetical protein